MPRQERSLRPSANGEPPSASEELEFSDLDQKMLNALDESIAPIKLSTWAKRCGKEPDSYFKERKRRLEAGGHIGRTSDYRYFLK